jgi:hypothetical protein
MKARMPKVTHPSTIRGMQRASRQVTTRRAGPLVSLSFRHASRTHPDTSLPKAAPTGGVRAQFVLFWKHRNVRDNIALRRCHRKR